jgi:hypothetical protein
MDPFDPVDAQQIVIAYARLLERDVQENRHPARVDTLPFAKPTIKSALCTSARSLAASGRLTDDLRDYLETAYSLLAEYLDRELVELMTDYRSSAERLAAEGGSVRDRTQSAAWRTLADTGPIAGQVARAVAAEAETLRAEFRQMLASA